MEFLKTMNNLHLALFMLTVSYGFVMGLKNTYYRLYCAFTTDILTQSTLGKYTDIMFYASILYFLFFYLTGT